MSQVSMFPFQLHLWEVFCSSPQFQWPLGDLPVSCPTAMISYQSHLVLVPAASGRVPVAEGPLLPLCCPLYFSIISAQSTLSVLSLLLSL